MSVVDRVYANALFEAAQEQGKLEPVGEQLSQLVEAEREVPELRELLRNPQLDPRARRAALEDVLGESDELLRNFLLVLSDKGRAGQLEEIAAEFERLVAEAAGIVNAELTTAVELSDDEADKLLQRAHWDVKAAIVMQKSGLNYPKSLARLRKAHDFVRDAIGEDVEARLKELLKVG